MSNIIIYCKKLGYDDLKFCRFTKYPFFIAILFKENILCHGASEPLLKVMKMNRIIDLDEYEIVTCTPTYTVVLIYGA